MTKGFHKKPSKRIPAKRRYKIEKKVREHNRKLKKELKNKNRRKRTLKDPGIPNSLPFKEKVLQELQEAKKQAEEAKEFMKLQMKRNMQLSNTIGKSKADEFETLLKNAEKRAEEFENKTQLEEYLIQSANADDQSCSNSKSFFKDVQNVIEASDVIIQVIDARDPLGTRCFEIEDIIRNNYPDKKIILLMNKCDLIPKDNLQKWLSYLRNSFITVPFKACTQSQKQHLSSSKVDIMLSTDDLLKSSKCLGINFLMKILNNYCHNKDVKTSLTIGIVGFPNVGKSSVINSLKRSQVCNVGPTPGLTRSMQTVSLDKKIKLIDSPGIVFSKNISTENTDSTSSILALRNALNIEKLKDPILPVQAILNRVSANDLMKIYDLKEEFQTVHEFLRLLAKRYGKIQKGGRMNLNLSARKVLHDWNSGKLKYYSIPPDTGSTTIDVKFVSEMSKEFDVNNFTASEEMMIEDDDCLDLDQFTSNTKTDSFLAMKPHQPVEMKLSVQKAENQNNKPVSRVPEPEDIEMMEEQSGMQLNKNIRQQFKKLKKQKRKETKLSEQLSEINLGQEDYDFEEYF